MFTFPSILHADTILTSKGKSKIESPELADENQSVGILYACNLLRVLWLDFGATPSICQFASSPAKYPECNPYFPSSRSTDPTMSTRTAIEPTPCNDSAHRPGEDSAEPMHRRCFFFFGYIIKCKTRHGVHRSSWTISGAEQCTRLDEGAIGRKYRSDSSNFGLRGTAGSSDATTAD